MRVLKHIKKICVSILLLLSFFYGAAQNGTEWIVQGQSYYKIKTFQTGVYAMPYSQLQAAGLNTFDLTNLQLWYRGQEQAIYLNNDSLFFYGKRNDGALDSLLYVNNHQANKYYNLLSDTSAYFLTNGSYAGKRIVSGNSTSATTASVWYYEEYLNVYTDQYYRGEAFSVDGTVKSTYDYAEGWFGAEMVKLNATPVYRDLSVPLANQYTAGSAPVLIEVLVSGDYPNSGRSVSLIIGNQNAPDFTFSFSDFTDYTFNTLSVTIPSSYLAGKTTLPCYLVLNSPTTDRIAPVYIKLTYPRFYILGNQGNKKFILENNGADKNISLINVKQPVFILDNTSQQNQKIIFYSVTNSIASFAVPAAVTTLFIHNGTPYTASVESTDMSLPAFTNAYNIIYPNAFESSAENYRQYRSSYAGGNFSTEKVSFEKLCNIFSYGEFSPISIKRFCTEVINANANEEKYLLLLGKAVVPQMTDFFANLGFVFYRKNPNYYWSNSNYQYRFANYVPTYGDPGSDLMYSVDVDFTAQIHTGRVSARSNAEIDGYLAKVQAHESLDSSSIWRKNIVHLSGGETAPQIAQFKQIVDIYKIYAQSPYFGGKVIKSYVKNLQNGSIDDQLIFNVAGDLNKGVSLITFFGHSSAEISDVDIGFVSNPVYGYNNTGKYPVLLVNGCTSANIFTNYSFAEDWIITPNVGAINVLGHSDLGYTNNLNQFSTYFYKFQFNDYRYRNKSIGFIHKKILDSINTVNDPSDIISQAQCTQMNLSGDPAIRMYSPGKTDYAIYGDNQTAERKCILMPVNTTLITSKDPFQIIMPVDNYGSTTSKSVEITIKRYVNNALTRTYQLLMPPVYYRDTIVYQVLNDDADYAGNNRFEIYIDLPDSLSEIRKDNNVAYLNYFMPSSAVKCLYPLNYGIVSQLPVALIAQPTNLLIGETEYTFEIDTSKSFTSPFKQSGVIQSGTLPQWTPQLLSNVQADSLVYFWRVKFKTPQQPNDDLWDNSSFIYIKNSNPGWSQTHIDQLLENSIVGLSYSKASYAWSFLTTSVNLKVYAVGGRFTSDPDATLLSIDNLPVLQSSAHYNCIGGAYGGLFLFILDRSSLLPKVYVPNSQGWFYCGQNYDTRYVMQVPYPFQTGGGAQGRDADGLISAIQHTNKNDYILLFNDGYSVKEYWANVLTKYFDDTLKAHSIAGLANGQQPFLLLTKRSAATPVSEKVNLHTDSSSFVSLDTVLTSFYSRGTITTPLIGPSSKWGKLYLAIDSSLNDHTTVELIRYTVSGSILDTIVLPKQDSLEMNGTYLVDGVHAYCKLFFVAEDTTTLTPPAIKKWQLIYNGVPEGSLNPYAIGLDKYVAQTKAVGDTLVMTYRFDNISDVDFAKPVKVVFSVRSESGNIKFDTVTYTVLPAKQNITFTYKVSTKGLIGKNYLQVYVNPQIQPEQYYGNNVLETIFTVESDKTQPVMEVAFDGVRIFDGDLVSASPLINVSLRDNNKYLLMQDPNSISLFLTYPGQTTPVQITSTNPMVRSWSLDNTKNNTFVAELKPTGLLDGTYTLMVQGKDASGNVSGNNSLYKISFQVENKPTISYFYPYPNPFSTSTRFVFTLSGTTPPSDLKIQIMTVAGTIVKEIFKEQLGPLHIGNNISDYAWDGTDEYGDRLANGVYLYRVIIKDDNQYFEHRNTAGDKAFKHDWGKMYILR